MACNDCKMEPCNAAQIKVLRTLFFINAVMFVAEMVAGILADSTGVMADSLDMLADASVYAIGMVSVGRAIGFKILAARASGTLQILIAVGILVDIVRRILGGSEPVSALMLGISIVALAANIYSLRKISEHRDGGVHMRASWIFSKNDVIANCGVILAAVLVYLTHSNLPDIVIGCLITLVVLRGGIEILRDAASEKQSITEQSC
ncbi:MAG: cation transporter [Verrucomicrobiaceae bacterium]|nr:MAG: cation transporter [Verrucomicrobiaceae bacterium]